MEKFETYRFFIFITLYIGFVLYHASRKAFSYAMPAIMEQEGLEKEELGLVTSALMLSYSVSKFAVGIASDYMSPKALFIGGLISSGIILIIFTWFSSAWMYCALYFSLGILQGGGYPSYTKIVRQWYARHEFGTWSSVISTAKNIASTAGPVLAVFVINSYGWRYLFHVFGVLCFCWVAFCIPVIQNKPEDIGFIGRDTVASESMGKKENGKKSAAGTSSGRETWKDLLKSPLFLSLCLIMPLQGVIKICVMDWTQMLMIQDLGMTRVKASIFRSTNETGGLIGSILTGYIGDKMTAKTHTGIKHGSPRLTLSVIFTVAMLFFLHVMLSTFSAKCSDLYLMTTGVCLGFAMHGSTTLINVISQEAAPSHLAGTSQAVLQLPSAVGSLLAGFPFTYVAKLYSWTTAFYILEFGMIPLIILVAMAMNFTYKLVPDRNTTDKKQS